MLQRTIDAGGSLLLTRRRAGRAHRRRCPRRTASAACWRSTLQGDRGATIGMLAVATADPDGLAPGDEGFAQAIANVVGTAIARWRADEEIARLGLHDPLTGLASRPLFENRLEQALDRARREQGDAAVLFVDLDGFGKLNDGFGYRTGDEVLVGVGARLVGCCPPTATAGRLAGDDFAVLVPGVATDAEALDVAERIGAALGEPMLAGGRELTMTASIGVVLTERGTASVIGGAAHGDRRRDARPRARRRPRGARHARHAPAAAARRRDRAGPAPRADRRRAAPALPADHRPLERDDRRRRGVRALAAPRARAARAGAVPRRRRGDRARRPARRGDPVARLPRARALGPRPRRRRRCTPRPRCTSTSPPRHFAAPGLAGTVSRALRAAACRRRPARARDRRDDVHGEGSRRSPSSTTCAASACGSRWIASAPATRRWRRSASCRSTR